MPNEYVAKVVEFAHVAVASQLAVIGLGRTPGDSDDSDDGMLLALPVRPSLPKPVSPWRVGALVAFALAWGCAVAWLVRAAGWEPKLLVYGVGVAVASGIGVWLLMKSASGARKRSFKRVGMSGPLMFAKNPAVKAVVSIAVLLCAALLSGFVSSDEHDQLVRAKILTAWTVHPRQLLSARRNIKRTHMNSRASGSTIPEPLS